MSLIHYWIDSNWITRYHTSKREAHSAYRRDISGNNVAEEVVSTNVIDLLEAKDAEVQRAWSQLNELRRRIDRRFG